MRRSIHLIIIGLLIAGVGAGATACRKKDPAGKLRTAPVKRGDLEATISATGTVEPEELVDVGAQVGGIINSFGKDKNGKAIDYTSVVEEGTVLACIDDSLYQADVESANAQLQQAQANQVSAEANIEQMQAKLDQARQDWDRAQKLGPSEALAPSAYDQYKANFEIAKANIAVAKAAVEQAKASQAQAKAALARAQRNLGYCTITSPVKGVIIDRRVNTGQTVVSSLSAPSLFLIAKDLTRIQVWVSVNEADIGSIHPGMPVLFTVDAFPNQVFHGQVGKVRFNATMTQNVVTYTVEVTTDNTDGKLLPYLTANARFVTGSCQNALLVPNAALKWQPNGQAGAAGAEAKAQSPGAAVQGPKSKAKEGESTVHGTEGQPGAGQKAVGGGAGAEEQGTVWVLEGESPRPVKVTVGLSDGTLTAVSSPELAEGMNVVVGEQVPQALAAGANSGGASPFTPQIGRGRSGGPPGGKQ